MNIGNFTLLQVTMHRDAIYFNWLGKENTLIIKFKKQPNSLNNYSYYCVWGMLKKNRKQIIINGTISQQLTAKISRVTWEHVQ